MDSVCFVEYNFCLTHNIFIKLNFYTENKQISNYVTSEYVGVTHYLSTKQIINNIIRGLLLRNSGQLTGAF